MSETLSKIIKNKKFIWSLWGLIQDSNVYDEAFLTKICYHLFLRKSFIIDKWIVLERSIGFQGIETFEYRSLYVMFFSRLC